MTERTAPHIDLIDPNEGESIDITNTVVKALYIKKKLPFNFCEDEDVLNMFKKLNARYIPPSTSDIVSNHLVRIKHEIEEKVIYSIIL